LFSAADPLKTAQKSPLFQVTNSEPVHQLAVVLQSQVPLPPGTPLVGSPYQTTPAEATEHPSHTIAIRLISELHQRIGRLLQSPVGDGKTAA
jgi:hypothetical protein